MNDLKYEFAKTGDPINQFASISHDHPNTRAAYPELSIESRRELYQKWHFLSEDSFLTLFRSSANGKLAPVAISIILPLKAEAEDVIDNNRWDALNAADWICTKKPSTTVLIDTWSVKKIAHPNNEVQAVRREEHGGWAMAMLGCHLQKFIERGQEVAVYIEPDEDHINYICDVLCFRELNGGKMWKLILPSENPSLNGRLYAFIENKF